MIVNETSSWPRLLFSRTGTGLQRSWPRIAAATGFAVLVSLLHLGLDIQAYSLTPTPFLILGVAIGIFLGFRNNTAYARFWEAPRVRIVVTVFTLLELRREARGDKRCRDIRWS